jgi:hypothetical protein
MSLINEALKRTRDASFQAGGTRPPAAESYRVSAGDDPLTLSSRSGTWVSLLVVAMAAVAVLVLSLRVTKPGRNLREAMSARTETTTTDVNTLEPTPTVVAQKPAPLTVPVVTPRPEKKTAEDQLVDKVMEKIKAEQTLVAKDPPAPVPVPVMAPALEPAKFVLQGVTSGAGWREALVNGTAVREGDDLDGARVVSIEARRVKLQLGEHEILLRMP